MATPPNQQRFICSTMHKSSNNEALVNSRAFLLFSIFDVDGLMRKRDVEAGREQHVVLLRPDGWIGDVNISKLVLPS